MKNKTTSKAAIQIAPPGNSTAPSLTPKEMKVLEFIESAIELNGISPTYQEIMNHFGLASFNSVQNYLKQLSGKGYIQINQNQKRALQVLISSRALSAEVKKLQAQSNLFSMAEPSPKKLLQASEEVLSLPLLGQVAAGLPLESQFSDEFIDVPRSLVRNPAKTFALKVKGQSMKEDGILDGDFILVQKQNSASNGDTVVAVIENEATVKKIYFSKSSKSEIELRPSNSEMNSFFYSSDQVEVKGILVGLVRKF